MGLFMSTRYVGNRKYACTGSLPLACIKNGTLLVIEDDLMRMISKSYLGDRMYKVRLEIQNLHDNGRVIELTCRIDDIFYVYSELALPEYKG